MLRVFRSMAYAQSDAKIRIEVQVETRKVQAGMVTSDAWYSLCTKIARSGSDV
jgi:hypothetical protein